MSTILIEPRYALTHKQAVKRMALWLRNSQGCSVVMAERVALTNEQPDVIGWKCGGSYMIECKVSRADFLADRDKAFRRYEDMGMGDYRYFAAPSGLLKAEDLPDGWGWLEILERQVRMRVSAKPKPSNKAAEVVMLTSCIRRLEMACTVFVRHEELPAAGAEGDGS